MKLHGLETIETLRFLNLSLNKIQKILQLRYIELLPLLTELDMCFNPIMDKKYYRLQVIFHIPQLRLLDGQEINPDEKIKAENLHGTDQTDRETIFKTLLPQEKFVDRRIQVIEDVEIESEDEISRQASMYSSKAELARNYVGELIQRVEINDGHPAFLLN